MQTKLTTILYFDDLVLMRRFRIYLLAHNIRSTASFLNNDANAGWIECDVDEKQKTTAQLVYGATLKR